MSLPEISRRCLSCGAAARVGSRFCQQCGKALGPEAAPGAPEERGAEAARAPVPPTGESSPQEQASPPAEDWAPPTKEFAAFEQSPGVNAPPPTPAEQVPVAAAPADIEAAPGASVLSAPASSEGPAREAEEAGEAVRAGDLRGRVARVREGTKARVGRMREEAIVALEETPDDSGLRFVFAAAALFVLFLVLLFLSTTVLR
ncbi:MAG: hypothetical protein JOZ96_02755 [Acidobacteria bacterium]|nr:hypothetical protein [Acidobacteriota bacterium]